MKKEEVERLLSLVDNKSDALSVIKQRLEHLISCINDGNVKDQIYDILECFSEHFEEDEIKKWLLNEKKYCEQKEMKLLTMQKAFEQYITTNLNVGLEKINFYGEAKGLFTFTNGFSIYQLKDPLYISEYILSRQRIGSPVRHRSRRANSEELERYINIVEQAMYRGKILFNGELKQYDKDTVIFEI